MRTRRDRPDRTRPGSKSERQAADRIYRSQLRFDRSLRSVQRLPRAGFAPGSIVEAWVPFADDHDYKRRPIIILETRQRDVVAVPCTSQSHRRGPNGVLRLRDWEAAGLVRPTLVLTGQPIRLDRTFLHANVGRCSAHDWLRVQSRPPA
jgi:hypothetical protein